MIRFYMLSSQIRTKCIPFLRRAICRPTHSSSLHLKLHLHVLISDDCVATVTPKSFHNIDYCFFLNGKGVLGLMTTRPSPQTLQTLGMGVVGEHAQFVAIEARCSQIWRCLHSCRGKKLLVSRHIARDARAATSANVIEWMEFCSRCG